MSIRSDHDRLFLRYALLLATATVNPCAWAQASSADNPRIPLFKPLVDVRARWEAVDQDGFAQQANAGTLRARLGFETAPRLQTALLAEGEFIWSPEEDYNSTVNGKTQYPVVGDPDGEALNRLQLTNTTLPDTTVTLGRQRILLDDQRFVGNSGWRQNEQTFDSLRVVNESIENVIVDIAYVDQVNRVFGKDSPVGRFEGDSVLANLSYTSPLGKLTAFGYALDFERIEDAPPAHRNAGTIDSSTTLGIRFAGERSLGEVKLGYTASYATQDDAGSNPIEYSADHYLGELSGTFGLFSAGLGVEVLEGTGTKGFTTPLSSLHKFQGWADKFLVTPANGIEDTYLTIGVSHRNAGPLDVLSALAVYHDYTAQRTSADYGSEVDLQVLAKWKKLTATLKYADYRADSLFTDTQKLWAQLEYAW